jgi:hypothetical protein
MPDATRYRETGEAAWSWVLAQVRDDDGPWLPEDVPVDGAPPAAPDDDRDSAYSGIAGLAPVLTEIARYRALTGTERTLADGIVARLTATAPERTEACWADGLAGHVLALRQLAPGTERVALRRLAELATPDGWPSTSDLETSEPITDLIMGTAGVVLAAAWAGGPDATALLTTGGTALLGAAERTEGGLDWRLHPGYPASTPNFAHGGTYCRSGRSPTAASSCRTPCRTPAARSSRSPTAGVTARPA